MATRRSLFEQDDSLLDADHFADLLGMTRKALYNARHAGQLPPPIKIGSRLRWQRSDVDAWLDNCRETEGVER